jgi:PST family polysaccharide transporter
MQDLTGKTLRGGMARFGAQWVNLVLRVGSMMLMARMLDPADFGLVGMVTAFTGVLNLLKDFGLSTATVQRATVDEEQMSTLFWINMLVGAVLSLVSLAAAPWIAAFYHEPKLTGITMILAAAFVFNAAGVQHSVILQRHMRFTVLAAIDVISLASSVGLGVWLALSGFGYWALVAMTVSPPIFATGCVWAATKWVPGPPRQNAEIRSMMRFGGTITLNGVIVYIGYNLEKVLLGRFWGAEPLGIYGRAYQLITTLWDTLNGAVGGVAFAALSRLQRDPERFKNYFLKGYSLVLTSTILIAAGCALFADELIVVVLGPKWGETAPVFRVLAPTVFLFGLLTPMGWLLFSLGLVTRSLRIALVFAPLAILGYVIGLPYGPAGVAWGYLGVMSVWVVPHIAWCIRGTAISLKDVWRAAWRPLSSIFPAALMSFGVTHISASPMSPLLTIVLGGSVLMLTYAAMLMYVMRQRAFYMSLWNGIRTPTADENALGPA